MARTGAHGLLRCSITPGLSPSSRRVLSGLWSQQWDVSSFLTFSSLEDYLKKKKDLNVQAHLHNAS